VVAILAATGQVAADDKRVVAGALDLNGANLARLGELRAGC
jgi:hypothetical protein